MKPILWIAAVLITVVGAGAGAMFVVSEPAKPPLASLLPEGALLYLEAQDFHSLLHDWESSSEKRAWLASDNYQDLSRSRLFTRLSQAQDEFAAAAGVPVGTELLDKVAGRESCLALYDIGNLEFVYLTQLPQQDAENTPLWQTRGKFEERRNGGASFYVREDVQSGRVSAFAVHDGWLILGTSEDLVAGVMNRLQSPGTHNLAAEGWFAETLRHTTEAPGDLRMVLNLDKIVPSPYFRSYWIQRNITEMKQYASAISDLYRTSSVYREERTLVRREGLAAEATGDIASVIALVPDDAGFWSALASPDPGKMLDSLRNDLLELKPPVGEESFYAPQAVAISNAGNESDLDQGIDQAPVVEPQADPWALFRATIADAHPTAFLEISSTANSGSVFVPFRNAAVVAAAEPWDEQRVANALSAALAPGLTTSTLGLGWRKHHSATGDYLALDGQVQLCVAVRGNLLVLSNGPSLIENIFTPHSSMAPPPGLTYAATFRHAQERGNFLALTTRLDPVGNRGSSDGQSVQGNGGSPAFFSGNIASLSRVFAGVSEERIEERDRGGQVTQTVTYHFKP